MCSVLDPMCSDIIWYYMVHIGDGPFREAGKQWIACVSVTFYYMIWLGVLRSFQNHTTSFPWSVMNSQDASFFTSFARGSSCPKILQRHQPAPHDLPGRAGIWVGSSAASTSLYSIYLNISYQTSSYLILLTSHHKPWTHDRLMRTHSVPPSSDWPSTPSWPRLQQHWARRLKGRGTKGSCNWPTS